MMAAAHFCRSSIASLGVGGTRPGPRELLGNMFVRMSKRMDGKRVGSRILVWMWWERSLVRSRESVKMILSFSNRSGLQKSELSGDAMLEIDAYA